MESVAMDEIMLESKHGLLEQKKNPEAGIWCTEKRKLRTVQMPQADTYEAPNDEYIFLTETIQSLKQSLV